MDKKTFREEVEKIVIRQYTHTERFGSTFWRGVIVFAVMVILILLFIPSFKSSSIRPETIQSSLEFQQISSKWVVNATVNEKDFQGIIVVPQISFVVKNIWDHDMPSGNMMGVYRYIDDHSFIGDVAVPVFRNKLKPGENSEIITLTSMLGYRGESIQAFMDQKKFWRKCLVDIYFKPSAGQYSLLKSYEISQVIDDANMDIKLVEPVIVSTKKNP
jgi:hypothetical protein